MSESKSLADNGFITEMKDKNGDRWYHQIVLETQKEKIKRLKEEYIMLQNASDKVEEEKDREIERLNNIINNLENELARVYEIELDYPIQFVKEEVEKVKLGVDKE